RRRPSLSLRFGAGQGCRPGLAGQPSAGLLGSHRPGPAAGDPTPPPILSRPLAALPLRGSCFVMESARVKVFEPGVVERSTAVAAVAATAPVPYRFEPGRPHPMGASADAAGVNFAVFS